jgi:chromosome partitioning protein
MGTVVALGNIKGGVGKTMLSVNFCARLSQLGEDVLLLDTDKQTSASSWWHKRKSNFPDLPRIHNMAKRGELDQTIEDLANRYKYVVVDLAGQGDSDELLTALQVCDILIIPYRPSGEDLQTLGTMERIVRNVRRNNKKMKPYFFVNAANPNPALAREVEMARNVFKEYPEISMMNTVVHDRVCFRDSYDYGLGVTDLEGSSSSEVSARKELKDFVAEVLNAVS